MKTKHLISLVPVVSFALLYLLFRACFESPLRLAWAYTVALSVVAAIDVAIDFFGSKKNIYCLFLLTVAIAFPLASWLAASSNVLVPLVTSTLFVFLSVLFCYAYSGNGEKFFLMPYLDSFYAVLVLFIYGEYNISVIVAAIVFAAGSLIMLRLAMQEAIFEKEKKIAEKELKVPSDKEKKAFKEYQRSIAINETIGASFFFVAAAVIFLIVAILFWPAASGVLTGEEKSKTIFSILSLFALILLAGYPLRAWQRKNIATKWQRYSEVTRSEN